MDLSPFKSRKFLIAAATVVATVTAVVFNLDPAAVEQMEKTLIMIAGLYIGFEGTADLISRGKK